MHTRQPGMRSTAAAAACGARRPRASAGGEKRDALGVGIDGEAEGFGGRRGLGREEELCALDVGLEVGPTGGAALRDELVVLELRT